MNRRTPTAGLFTTLAHRGLNRLLGSQLIIAVCAVALTLETSLIAGVKLQPYSFYAFLFLSTLASYRIHAHVAQSLAATPTAQGRSARLMTAGVLCAAGVMSLQLNAIQFGLACVAAVVAWLYSVPLWPGAPRLRDWGVLKIVALTGTWTLITAVLPLLDMANAQTIAFLATRRFLFVFALCMAFDVRDLGSDARLGVRTLAVRAGRSVSFQIVRTSLSLFALLSIVGPSGPLAARELPLAAALISSAIASWAVIERTRVSGSHFLYLAGVDGMMLIQSLFVWGAWVIGGR